MKVVAAQEVYGMASGAAEETTAADSWPAPESISVRIELGDPWVVSGSERRPLSELGEEGPRAEIRSGLRIIINGRPLPDLEQHGHQGVSLATWLGVLRETARIVGKGDGRFEFDEGTEGMPRFVFRREGDALLVSVTASMLSGADGYDEWHQEACCARGFVNQVSKLFVDFERLLAEVAPGAGERWLQTNVYG